MESGGSLSESEGAVFTLSGVSLINGIGVEVGVGLRACGMTGVWVCGDHSSRTGGAADEAEADVDEVEGCASMTGAGA